MDTDLDWCLDHGWGLREPLVTTCVLQKCCPPGGPDGHPNCRSGFFVGVGVSTCDLGTLLADSVKGNMTGYINRYRCFSLRKAAETGNVIVFDEICLSVPGMRREWCSIPDQLPNYERC